MEATQIAPVEPDAQPELANLGRDAGNVCRVRTIRAFFKAAKTLGLDIENAEGMRAALVQYFGCIAWSRRNLSVGHRWEVVVGLECNLIAW